MSHLSAASAVVSAFSTHRSRLQFPVLCLADSVGVGSSWLAVHFPSFSFFSHLLAGYQFHRSTTASIQHKARCLVLLRSTSKDADIGVAAFGGSSSLSCQASSGRIMLFFDARLSRLDAAALRIVYALLCLVCT